MKFCFSSMLMTSWVCQKQSRSMKDFEIRWRLNSRSNSSESPNTHFLFSQRKQHLHLNGAPFDSKKVSGIWKWKIRSSFVSPAHWKFDAARHLDKTRYFILHVNSFPILFKSSLKRLDIGSKSSYLPQNYSRFSSFPKLWARRTTESLTNAQSCRKTQNCSLSLSDSDLASCEETRRSTCGACIFFGNSRIFWKSGKQNHVSRSTTEAEFYALLEGITEVAFLRDVFNFAYKVDKRIFNCKSFLW